MSCLETLANLAAIATAIVAAGAAAHFWLDARAKRRKVEEYLRTAKDGAQPGEKGQRSILHLMAKIGLTEAEVLHASFSSKRIRRALSSDEDGRADAILLEYFDPRA